MIQTLQQIVSILTAILLTLQATLAGMPAGTQLAQVSPTASVSLSPSSYSASVNNTFTVNIAVNTGGQGAYGVDINHLHFNPSVLQVVDADGASAGTQIAAGALMPLTIINLADNTGGSIQFSQLANPGSTYNGSGTLAVITFRALAVGISNTAFDFSLGNSTDTNVAGLGGDLLASAGSGSYTVTSLPDITAPTAPGTPSLNVMSSSQINLSWTASTDNVAVTGYRVERCSGSATCTTYSQVATPAVNSYSDTGLSASTIYRYRIRATDAAGNLSAYSSAASATTQAPPDITPPTISAIAVSGVTVSGATITWTTNEPGDTQVDYGLTASYGASTALNSSLATSHSATLSGLSAGTVYHYMIRSRDAAGNLALSFDNSLTTQTLPDTTSPTVPAGVTATATSENQIQISWTASTDPTGAGQAVSGVSDYQIFRGGVSLGTTASTAYLDTGLTAGATYSYQVAAVDVAGNVSARSASVSATTPMLSLLVQRRIILVPEGTPASQRNVSGTVEFLNPSNLSSKIYQASFTTNTSGQYTIDVPAGLLPTVTLRPVVSGYLSKLLGGVDLRNISVLDVNFPTLPAGDFNSDQLINSLDFSYMNGKWGASDTLADVNRDGLVNSLDFAYLSNNWMLAGE